MTISFEQIIPFEQTSDGHALDRLLAKLVNEALNAEELQQLEQLLKKSPDARAHYLRHLDLHSCLSAHWGVVDSLALPTKKKSDPKLRRRSSDHGRFRPNAWATAATLAVVVLGAVIWQIVLSSKPQSFEVLVNHSEESYHPAACFRLLIIIRFRHARHNCPLPTSSHKPFYPTVYWHAANPEDTA